ncbi:outer membrane beta-barrel protein [Filimonas effusa]|uniref:Outer membrane protein beta-barrel domain-containing protein n=1 Tax=Filimonas effusa TaxID=2508721 RepID=A0A4Q1D5P3_9BACT|nr:outer membrane beta-barrel protein [Filimonas effusa]RXK83789.1 hypothetical protein ESB13_17100 [Filimonas effusa]
MKKIFLFIIAIALLSVAASAQITKGSSYLGGDIGLSHSKSESDQIEYDTKATTIGASASIGFAYKENRVWGLSLNYTYLNSEDASQDRKLNGYGAGVFLRQYKPLGKGFYLFANEGLNLLYSVEDWHYSAAGGTWFGLKTYSASVGLSPGVAYDVNRKFQLELSLNNMIYADYSHQKSPDPGSVFFDGKSTRNTFSLGSDLNNLAKLGSVRIGARWVLGRHK